MNKNQVVFYFIFSFFYSFSQVPKTVKGVVIDPISNSPLIGATVAIQNSTTGTLTDFNGNFELNFIRENNKKYTLQVAYIGYKTSIISISETKKYYEIFLSPSKQQLDEVVITSSYGTKKLREEVVGSISTINPKNIVQEQAVVSFEELLEGQVAGLSVEINPQLGENVAIDIRGKGSLTPLNGNIVGTSTQPLFIVDGVILSEETGIDGSSFFDSGTDRFSENFLNPLAKIGIENIESINVLKDAAAVGIYGADAANGVIIITTKKGRNGKTQFNASIQSGFSTAINQFKYLSGEEYQQVVNEFNRNAGNLNNIQPWNGIDTDWFNLLNTIGAFSRYNLNISGGSDKVTFRAGAGFQKNNEAQINNSYQKLNTSFALDYNKQKLAISLKLAPSFVKRNNPNTLYNFAVRPTLALYDKNGDFSDFDFFGNPLAVANQNISSSSILNLLNSLKIDYQLTPKLKFYTLLGSDISFKDEEKFFSGLNGTGQLSNGSKGRRIIRTKNTTRYNWNGSLFYETSFKNKHFMDAIIGTEVRIQNVNAIFMNATDFKNFGTPQPINAAKNSILAFDSTENKGISMFSQFNYNFYKRYFLLANYRIDKSSVFGTDNNTAFNGGLGASWNISNEAFLINNNFINFLRLRFSYGTTGNSRIGSYRALGLFSRGNRGFNDNLTAKISALPNPNLGWEKNTKFNLGLDFNFLNTFKLTTEIFRDNISDVILLRDVIPEIGLLNAQINGAEMYNQGLEISLNSSLIKSEKFNWNSTFFFTKIENKVTALSGFGSKFSGAENARAQRIGFPTSTLWGFNFLGIDTATGNELYKVKDQIYNSTEISENFERTDWQPIGDTQPDFFGGFNNTFQYKNLSLSVNISYTYGADVLLGREFLDNYNILFNRNINVNVFEDAWRKQGDLANLPAITKARNIISNSSKYVFDTSHIKLKTINLAYQFPIKKMKIPLKKLSLFVNGSNLFYWFKNPSPNGKNGVAEYRSTYPEMRTISFGLNTRF